MENHKALFNLPDYVLVHPQLTEDPVSRQGQVGRLTQAVVNRDEYYVGFDGGEVGIYEGAALLMLKDADAIFKHIDLFKDTLTEYEHQTLISIALLEMYAEDSGYQQEAFTLALQHPSLLEDIMVSIDTRLQWNRGPELGR
jgi:hypothetical protein